MTTGIYLISESSLHFAYLRGKFFKHNAEIEKKDRLWTGTNYSDEIIWFIRCLARF